MRIHRKGEQRERATGGQTETLGHMETSLPWAHRQITCTWRTHTVPVKVCLCVFWTKGMAWGILCVYLWQCTPPCQTQAGRPSNKKRRLPHFACWALSSSLNFVCETFQTPCRVISSDYNRITSNSCNLEAIKPHKQNNQCKATET